MREVVLTKAKTQQNDQPAGTEADWLKFVCIFANYDLPNMQFSYIRLFETIWGKLSVHFMMVL
jgi:hypothetical protein